MRTLPHASNEAVSSVDRSRSESRVASLVQCLLQRLTAIYGATVTRAATPNVETAHSRRAKGFLNIAKLL